MHKCMLPFKKLDKLCICILMCLPCWTNYSIKRTCLLLLNVIRTETNHTLSALKELEHRKLGLKVLILKYDIGKSLSKEMWCKMADTKTFLTTYLKSWKMHVIWSKSFLCPWTRKWFPLIMNGILEMPWFVHIFLQN